MSETRTLEGAVQVGTQRLRTFVDPVLRGKWWTLRVGAVVGVLAYAAQAPAPPRTTSPFWHIIVGQGRHPFRQIKAIPGSHESSLTWRLVPPLLIRFSHMTRLEYYEFQMLLGVLTLALLAYLFERLGYSRGESFALVAALGFTYVGGAWFIDAYPAFDALALTALVAAMVVKRPELVFIAMTIAAWTDERALIAAVVVAMFQVREKHIAAALSVLVAVVAYIGVRAALASHYALKTNRALVGPSVLKKYYVTMPLALATTLEALWGLLALGLVAGLIRRERTAWVVTLAALASAGAAVLVTDVTRSAIYLLPAIVMACAYLVKETPRVRTSIIGTVLIVCIIFPTTGVIANKFGWFDPLPVREAHLHLAK